MVSSTAPYFRCLFWSPLSFGVRSVDASAKAVEDLLLALIRVPQAVPQMIQTVVPFFSQVRGCVRACCSLVVGVLTLVLSCVLSCPNAPLA